MQLNNETVETIVDAELSNLFGVYGTYNFFGNTDSGIKPFVVLGYTEATWKVTLNDQSERGDNNGLSYGAGVRLGKLSIEYMNYLSENSNSEVFDFTAVSVGYTISFK